MLILDGGAFTCGRAKFADSDPRGFEPTPKIYIRLRFGRIPQPIMAQMDTGAAWSILAPDIAKEVAASVDSGDPARLSTRFGTMTGRLVRVGFSFLADEGKNLETEGTFFVSPDWPEGLNFLGYSGLLDSIRFALDPQKNHFYFGAGL